jgi:trk system potassium uptake protein TrkH
MNNRAVLRVLGFILVVVGVAMLPPLVVAAFQHTRGMLPLLVSSAIPTVLGTVLLFTTRGKVDLRIKDGFAIVTLGWLAAALFGSLPYLLVGVCSNPIDAFFESMSGFTTTGSTIFTDIESVPPGILLWRSTTQWLGGMGIVVITIAVLPLLGVGGMQLFKAEVPGPVADRLSPRIQSVAKSLWGVYLALTVAETGLLLLGGMNLFDAVNHSFTTLSTGGFSTRNASLAAFPSPFIQITVIVFMFLAGTNFSLHLWFLRRGARPDYWRNEEFRLYAVLAGGATLLVAAALVLFRDSGVGQASLDAAFQVVSILTTTGFGSADYLLWGFGSQILLFCFMFMGACAGSTSGGMKLMRMIVLFKHGVTMAYKEIHPRAIYKLRFNGTVVPDDVMMRILGFFLLWIFLFFVVALLLGALGVDMITAMGASVACLGNIGPGFGEVGPTSNFAALPGAGKVLLALAMLLGRLELYTVLVILTPPFWKRV